MIKYEGLLLCDKPFGVTSHDVISRLRQTLGQKKIGHIGTLDPRATGLLVICLERATKIAQFLDDLDKAYEAQITLGLRSRTFDSEGIMKDDIPAPVPKLSEAGIRNILETFKGKITQKVPAHSAVKVGGERLYQKARRGEEVTTPEREIEIKELEFSKQEENRIDFRVVCSKGTYIRSLANDIGDKIGCGAYLSRLRRTQVGPFSVDQALTLGQVKNYREAGALKRFIIPIEKALLFPALKIKPEFEPFVLSGKTPEREDILQVEGEFSPQDFICLKDSSGRIMAVGTSDVNSVELELIKGKPFFKYVRVLN